MEINEARFAGPSDLIFHAYCAAVEGNTSVPYKITLSGGTISEVDSTIQTYQMTIATEELSNSEYEDVRFEVGRLTQNFAVHRGWIIQVSLEDS